MSNLIMSLLDREAPILYRMHELGAPLVAAQNAQLLRMDEEHRARVNMVGTGMNAARGLRSSYSPCFCCCCVAWCT